MKKAKPIMIQGTMSNAGKSIIAAGLCRVFLQDGYKVAPFKSQNMALNSFITPEGHEIGRAQAVQAEASKIAPNVDMNPILLKPSSHTGSQVIVHGKPIGNMAAAEYFAFKKSLVPHIMESYNRLAGEYDIIVIEGAGSPAEINLKENDIVNMGFAKMVGAPVILVGDIDRGGVFAQLYGTVMLLEELERAYIKGLVVNKFRGDVSILKPGLNMIEDRLNIPVLATVPYGSFDIDDEDSLSDRLTGGGMVKDIDIAVIRLPYISNFTDFSPFERFENVSLRYISYKEELGNPDMVIIPGTKSTVSDLKWLRQSGIESRILQLKSEGKVIFGVCGGFQMLGESIIDEQGVEDGGNIQAMGLLPVETVFQDEKVTKQVKGKVGEIGGPLKLGGLQYEGYEIHMGITKGDTSSPVLNEGTVYGTYIHGIFDNSSISGAIVDALCRLKGIEPGGQSLKDINQYKNEQYDKLADILRESFDMDIIYSILDEGI